LSRYRDSNPYKNGSSHYRTRSLDHYKPFKPYARPVRKYSKPPVGRGGRSRLPYPKPQYFQSQKPEKKYEPALKTEHASSPLTTKTSRYTIENPSFEPWVDTDEIAKDVEKKLDSKLIERLLEKFEAELEELMRRVEKGSETLEKSTEKPETEQGAKRQVEAKINDDHEQKEISEIARTESIDHSSEIPEESKEDEMPLDGGFRVSRTFGVAIPTEPEEQDSEQMPQESKDKDEITDKESEADQTEVETAESESKLDENREQEEIEDLKVEEDEVEDEAETKETENLDGIEELVESEDSSAENTQAETMEVLEDVENEIAPEEMTETDEMMPEPVPEETELYPVEDSQEVEVI